MKLGLMMALFGNVPFEQALDRAAAAKLDAVEIGVGNYPGGRHVGALAELAASKTRARDWAAKSPTAASPSAPWLSRQSLHPDRATAKAHHEVWRHAVKLAAHVGLDTITGFSGCPGGSPDDKYPTGRLLLAHGLR